MFATVLTLKVGSIFANLSVGIYLLTDGIYLLGSKYYTIWIISGLDLWQIPLIIWTPPLQQLVVFLVVFCHKMGIQIGPKLEVGGPKDPQTYAWLTHCLQVKISSRDCTLHNLDSNCTHV